MQDRGQRTSGLKRSSAQLLCSRLTMSRRRAWLGTWRLQSDNRGFWPQRRRCRLRSYTAKCLWHNRPSCPVRADLALTRAGRPCTSHRQNWRRKRNGAWPRRYDSVQHRMQARAPRVLCVMGICASNLWLNTLSTRFGASTGEPGPDHRAEQHTLRRLIEQAGG